MEREWWFAMDQQREPLAWRLRDAALQRTDAASERVDDFVLDEDGVIDLRALDVERQRGAISVADPAPILATMRGKFGDAAEVSDLYDTAEEPSPRWRLGLRARHAYGDQVPSAEPPPSVEHDETPAPVLPPAKPLSRISVVPLSSEMPEIDEEPVATAAPAIDAIEPEIDPRGNERPTAECPQCAGLGRRDLFDRFSQVEFYSCDHCLHMWQQEHRG